MRRLRGGIPRTFKNHRTPKAYVYRALLRAKIEHLGSLPADARVTLREYGRLAMDMQRLHEEKDRAEARGRVTVARRIDKRLTPMRTQLVALELRLEALAGGRRTNGDDPVERLLASMQRDGNG